MKILFLILGTKKKPWKKIASGQQKTWIRSISKSDEYKYIYGDGKLGFSTDNPADLHRVNFLEKYEPNEICLPSNSNKNSWTFPSKSGWSELLSNTVSSFHYALAHSDFQFLVRTNVSSYWNLESTHKLIQKFPQEAVYAGTKTSLWIDPSIEYVSGNSIILSRDLVELIVEKHQMIDSRVIDDVALGLFLKSEGVQITDVKHLVLESVAQVKDIGFNELFSAHTLRCKSESQGWNGRTRRNDSAIFRAIYNRLSSS